MRQLAKPAAAGLKQVAQRNAGRVLGTDAALQAWEQANERAHSTLIRIVESDVASGEVELNLGTLFEQMAAATGLPPDAVAEPPAHGDLASRSPAATTSRRRRTSLNLFETLVWVLLDPRGRHVRGGHRRCRATGAGTIVSGRRRV